MFSNSCASLAIGALFRCAMPDGLSRISRLSTCTPLSRASDPVRRVPDHAAEATPETVAFQREDPIRMDGQDALIPYVDQRSGAHYVARCAPDGSVRLER